MTSSARKSPGVALLRSSRLFSLPGDLRPPPMSDHLQPTTTQTFPTRQSLATPPSCQIVGEWGLKRRLPTSRAAKAAKLSKPTIRPMQFVRVYELDTREGITEFNSASDHTMTLKKWQEIGIPISRNYTNEAKDSVETKESVQTLRTPFDVKTDVTYIPSRDSGKPFLQSRWRFRGPSLMRITEAEFRKFMDRDVLPRREEFREFVRQKLVQRITKAQQGDQAEGPVSASNVSESQVTAQLRALREDRLVLATLVREFLDLPPMSQNAALLGFINYSLVTAEPGIPELPRAHPSLGLAYSRTSQYLVNHPTEGPLQHHPPVPARVLVPTGFQKFYTLGVAGWAVQKVASELNKRSFDDPVVKSTAMVDPNMQSPPIWVQVESATASWDGKLKIEIATPSMEVTWLQQSRLEDLGKPDAQLRTLSLTKITEETLKESRRTAADIEKNKANAESYGLKPADAGQPKLARKGIGM